MSISDSASLSRQTYVIPKHQSPQQSTATNANKPDLPVNVDTFIPQGKSGLIVAKENVSESHVGKANQIVLALPSGLQKHFRDQGCQVKLAKTMGEIFPHTIGRFDESDRSQTQKRRCEEIRGGTIGGTVGIPELIKKPGQDTFVPQTPVRFKLTVLNHELGHALHNTSSLLYKKDGRVHPDFYKAYRSDLAQLSPQDRERFRYYIQADEQGKATEQGGREAFAEIFASLYGGGCQDPEATKKAFPKTRAYLEQAVKSLIETEE